MKRKMRKYVVVLLGVVFTLIGIGFIAFNIYRIKINNDFMYMADPVYGEIDDITYSSFGPDSDDREYYVSYEYNGKEYKHVKLSFGQMNFYVGKGMILFVDPDNPINIKSEDNIIFERRFLFGVGGFALVIGLSFLLSTFYKGLKHKKLLEKGNHIYATVDHIEIDTRMEFMGRHPYIVVCYYEDLSTREKQIFKSDFVTFNPNESYSAGDRIDVYVDPYNSNKYYVDVRDKSEDGFM